MKIKFFFKKIVLNILLKIGFLRVLHYKNRKKICVLMLHGVMAPHIQTSWVPLRDQLNPNDLKRTLNILSEYYQFITIEQCVDILDGKSPPIDNAILITFDDGYRNNIDYALPICESFSIKPVLFVTTSHINSGLPFWFDRLDYALQQNMGEVLSLTYQGYIYHFDARTREDLIISYKKFRDDCKQCFNDDIKLNNLFNGLSEILEARSGLKLSDISDKDDWSAIVSWETLKEAVSKGRLDVASHTEDHLRLDCLNEDDISSQLKQSKVCIENELAVKCHYFCYPNGNYNGLAIKLVKEAGYRAAFSTDIGLCESMDDLMTLKRFNFPAKKTPSELLYLLNTK